MNTLGQIVLPVVLLFPSLVVGGDTIELSTPAYLVTIADNCESVDFFCKDVTLQGLNKKTKEKIDLKGQASVRYCADGKTPCEHTGYVFFGNNISYEYFHDGRLHVFIQEKDEKPKR